jgi:hypothetical protein
MSKQAMSKQAMSKQASKQASRLFLIITFCAFASAAMSPALAAEVAPPDMRGTWKGNSETIVLGGGNLHHAATATKAAPEFRSVPFTMVIDKQDGRRFSGTFASPRKSEKVLAVISRTGAIYMVTDDVGYTVGSILASDRIELCYMHVALNSHISSCTELTKQQ